MQWNEVEIWNVIEINGTKRNWDKLHETKLKYIKSNGFKMIVLKRNRTEWVGIEINKIKLNWNKLNQMVLK